jgi:hypothetical protein
MEMGPGWLIQTLDSEPVPDLDSFISVIKGLPDGKRVPITYCSGLFSALNMLSG